MTTPRGPRKLFFFVVPAGASVFTLLAIEVALRLVHPIPYAPEHNMMFDPDPDTGYRLRPGGVALFGNGAHAVASSQGLRNREVRPKPPGAYRILAVGDSFTEGAGVEAEEAWPQVLETLLASRATLPVEVVNAGVGGWDPFQYAQFFERRGLAFQPDLVVIGFFVGNDTYSSTLTVEVLPTAIGGRRVSREAAQGRWIRVAVFLQDHFHLARALRGGAPGFPPRRSCDDFSAWCIAAEMERLENIRVRSAAGDARAQPNVDQVLRIRTIASVFGIPVVVALLPDENQINPALQARLLAGRDAADYDFGMPQKMLRDLFTENDVVVVDLLPAFRGDPRCLYMNDTHWNRDGQALAAGVIANALTSFVSRGPGSRARP